MIDFLIVYSLTTPPLKDCIRQLRKLDLYEKAKSILRLVRTLDSGKSLKTIEAVTLKKDVLFNNGSQSSFILLKTAHTLVCTDGSKKEKNGLVYKLTSRDQNQQAGAELGHTRI